MNTEEAIASHAARKADGENWIMIGEDAYQEIQDRTEEAVKLVSPDIAKIVEVSISLGLRKYM